MQSSKCIIVNQCPRPARRLADVQQFIDTLAAKAMTSGDVEYRGGTVGARRSGYKRRFNETYLGVAYPNGDRVVWLNRGPLKRELGQAMNLMVPGVAALFRPNAKGPAVDRALQDLDDAVDSVLG